MIDRSFSHGYVPLFPTNHTGKSARERGVAAAAAAAAAAACSERTSDGGGMLHVILENGSNTTRYGKLRMEGPNLPNVTRSRRGVLLGDKLRKMNCYAVLFCVQNAGRQWQRIGAVMCPREGMARGAPLSFF